ncbi:hypothetical protein LCGC14_0380260 [marine sediment metagenome]|uniref:Uncharacterized protein n=1 Tax=marine sediment metagenome TaxID=412755 RepID=A0A0F9T271_9ZZZZ
MAELIVQFKTIEDVKNFRTKLQGIRLQLFQFQAATVRNIGEILVLGTIHARMRAAGFSEKIIDGTILDNIEVRGTKKVRLFFRSEYWSDTHFDVALAREKGTKKHFIKPVKKKALHGGSKWPFFSKGHEVSGIVALKIVKNTVKQLQRQFQDAYRLVQLEWYAENLGGIVRAG